MRQPQAYILNAVGVNLPGCESSTRHQISSGARSLEGLSLMVDSRLKKLVAAGPLPAA